MNEDRATRYQRLKRRGRVASVLAGVGALAVVALTPASRWVVDRVAAMAAGLPSVAADVFGVAGFAIVLVLWCQLAALPARLYLGLRVDARYGPDEAPTPEGLIGRHWLGALVAVPLVVMAAIVIRLSVWAVGRFWWLIAGLLATAALAAALHVAPRLLRWLAGAKSLDRGALAARLSALASRAGVPVREVCALAADRGRSTAAVVSGTGSSRRVFVSADLLRDWSDDEIAVVVAHELGHHAHDDLRQSMVFDGMLLTAGLAASAAAIRTAGAPLGLLGAGDAAALPLIALVTAVVWIAGTPLRLALSRRQERRADAFALALTDNAGAFDTAIRRLGARHLAEERPALWTRWLFHRHPSMAERLAYARRAARG